MNILISDKISIDFRQNIYASRSKEPRISNSAIRTVSIPSPFAVFFGRIIHHCWLMNKYVAEINEGSIELCAARGRKLVVIELAQNQEISLKVKNLILWTDGIRLHTKINFSAVHIACGMTFVQTATGPGKIVLEISGDPVITDSKNEKIPPDRLVAWNSDIIFNILGVHTILDLYYNRPLVKIEGEGKGVLDSDDGESRGIAVIFKLMKKFYIP